MRYVCTFIIGMILCGGGGELAGWVGGWAVLIGMLLVAAVFGFWSLIRQTNAEYEEAHARDRAAPVLPPSPAAVEKPFRYEDRAQS